MSGIRTGQLRNEKGSWATLALLAIVLFLLTVFSGLALADGDPGGAPESAALVIPDSLEELEALSESSQLVDSAPTTDPVAAEELPHTNLARDEAEELLVSVFPSALEEQAGVYGDLEVEAFRSDHVAVVPPDARGEEPGLLSSLLPLRAETEDGTKEAVSLDLENSEGTLEPENPLVEVQIPTSLDDGISLPETGVSIELQESSDRDASVVSGAGAFFPNVAEESDLTVVPTPTGVETLTQLRSAESPTTQRFELILPPGASLQGTDNGGAVVTRNGNPLIVVRPPSAMDAEGNAVPVAMEVTGTKLTLTATPAADAALPILVDPVFESYSWMNNNNNAGWTDWREYTSNEARLKPSWIGVWGNSMHAGLNLRSYPGSVAPGSQANFNYYVPRYFSDWETVKERPTTYIRSMNLSQVYYLIEEGSPVHTHPYMLVCLWDENKGEFAVLGLHYGNEGQYQGISLPTLVNKDEVTDVKNGGFALATYESTSYPRQAFVGSATVEVTDKDIPGFGELGSVPQWVSSQTGDVPYKATDAGLGIHDLRIRYPAAQGGRGEGMITVGCVGSASSPCPRTSSTTNKPLLFDAGALAQGENWAQIYAVDPVGHWSSVGESRIKVDRVKPELGLSGSLTEQASVGTKLAQYALTISGKDGDEATATATTPVGTVGTGPGQVERPFGVAADSAGNVWIADTTNNRVVELDKNGIYVRQITTTPEGPFKEIRGITVAPDGNVWVAEKGNKRVIKFSATGQFISKFTNAAVEPFDVAVSPGGTVWVTDPTAQKVWQFKEDGTVIRTLEKGNSPGKPLNSSDLPFGIALDEFGNAWIAMQATNRILEISPTGSPLFAFGSTGSATGQFNAPFDVSVAPSGNLFVSDGLNHRIQEFKPDGGFMRQFGTQGTASNQLDTPKNIAIAPGNRLLVADYNNKRIARWDHADRHVESGAVKTEVKVDGTLKDTYAPGCAAGKNCSATREWTLKADEYTVGTHKVEVFATDGAGNRQEKTLNVETHGDRTAPTVALTGSITEQATLGKTLPTYKVKVSATDPGPAEDRKSGVASIKIMVDGKIVDSISPGCPAEGCSLNREWTLNSSAYLGWHWLEVVVTDGAGKSKTVLREFETKKDTTAPEMTLSGALPGAPEGWVQQGTRSATAEATDQGGYGVKQIRFSIDGAVVGESLTQTCEAGSCPKSKTFWIDMNSYSGGAHEAVMVAEDLAGNIRKKTWTINVDPEGHISASEAEDTLEAVQATNEAEIVEGDASSGLPIGAEWGEDPTLIAEGEDMHSLGSPVEAELTNDPADGFELHTAEGTASITPVTVGPNASATGLSTGGASAITANTASGVDSVVRPIFDGSMTFQSIREASSAETFSWTVNMSADQTLKLIDPQFAEVYTGDHPQFAIIAEDAHDATGISVPTTLSIAGDVLTLTVHHHAGNLAAGGAPFTYPITQGLGWEGGLRTYFVDMPPPTTDATGEIWGGWGYVSPPEPIVLAEDPEAASASSVYGSGPRKRFTWVLCSHSPEFTPEGYPLMDLADGDPEWEAECGNPWTGDKGHNVRFYETIRGKFIQRTGSKHSDFSTWHEGNQTDAIGCMAGGYGLEHEAGSGTFRRGRTNKCQWWGETQDTRPKYATWGEHLTAVHRGVSEERAGCGDHCGRSNPWVEHDMPPMAYYFWANSHYAKHVTDCIDC